MDRCRSRTLFRSRNVHNEINIIVRSRVDIHNSAFEFIAETATDLGILVLVAESIHNLANKATNIFVIETSKDCTNTSSKLES